MIKELISELYPLIEKTAPAIARALGLGKLSTVAPWALYFLSKAFGIRMTDVKELPTAIINDPESDHKLKQLENSFSDWVEDNKEVFADFKISNLEVNVKVNFDTNLNAA